MARIAKVILFWVCIFTAPSLQAAQWTIGILALRGEAATRNHWQPLIDYLNATIPDAHFQLRPLDLNGMRDAVNTGSIQFVLTNQAQFVQLNSRYHLRWLSSLRSGMASAGESSTTGSAILVRNNSQITAAQDLAGKTLGAIDPQAFGGYLLGYNELRNAGMDPEADARVRFVGFPADALLYLLREDAIQAAIVPVCLLESMSSAGLIDKHDFRVLLQKSTSFPCATSTALYPDWSFAALPGVGDPIADAVTRALLTSPETGAWRWGAPASTSDTEALLRQVNRHPEQQRMGQAFSQWLIQHKLMIALALLAMVVFVANYAWVMILVNRRGKALERANKQLRSQQRTLEQARQMSVLGEMASGFAHELNQPISAIRMYAQGCLIRLTSANKDEALERALTHIDAQADRCGTIIQNLRKWAGTEKDNASSTAPGTPLNIADTVRHVLTLLQLDKSTNPQVVVTSIRPVVITLPPVLLEQVVANIILNAVQAGASTVWIDIISTHGQHTLNIQDDAGGISPEHLPALFQPFNSTKSDGMGLGLVICQRLLRSVNGEISVVNNNAPNNRRGLLVTLSFPEDVEITDEKNDSFGR